VTGGDEPGQLRLTRGKDAAATTSGAGACGGGSEILRHDLTAEEGAAHQMGMNGEGISVNSQLPYFFPNPSETSKKNSEGVIVSLHMTF
jgi:hypothetical protein